MGPTGYARLARMIPLGELPASALPALTVLYHFGRFNAGVHVLDRPMWVTDRYLRALQYRGAESPFLSALSLKSVTTVVLLRGIDLPIVAKALRVRSEANFYTALSKMLIDSRVSAVAVDNGDIFLPNPGPIIARAQSRPAGEIHRRR